MASLVGLHSIDRPGCGEDVAHAIAFLPGEARRAFDHGTSQ